jgi:periplasmic protein TonB
MSTLRDNWALPEGATEEEATRRRSFFRAPGVRYAGALAVIALLFGGVVYWFFGGDDLPPPRPIHEITIVNITPPPPPPPPPPPEQKMIEQPKMAEQEFKEDKPVEKPPEPAPDNEANAKDEPPGPATLNAPVGPGGLLAQGKGGGGGGGGGGSRWGYYASMVQTQVQSALQANRRTRLASMPADQIRLWVDGTGRISRVQLMASTGDAELDSIIRDEVLGKLTLSMPPPKDMPQPMVIRVTEHRPS